MRIHQPPSLPSFISYLFFIANPPICNANMMAEWWKKHTFPDSKISTYSSGEKNELPNKRESEYLKYLRFTLH